MHGPVLGYAKASGKTVAISRKRSSRGKDVLFQLMFRDLTLEQGESAKTFFKAAAKSPFTFNAAYADDRDIAMYSAGLLPRRHPRVDPRLPTKGTGPTSGAATSRPPHTRSRSTRPPGRW